jgi:GLPGLI family protein
MSRIGLTIAILFLFERLAAQNPAAIGYIQYFRTSNTQKIDVYFSKDACMSSYPSPPARELPVFKDKKYPSKEDSLQAETDIRKLDETMAEHPLNPAILYHRLGDPFVTRTDFDNNFDKYCLVDSISEIPQWELLPDTTTILGFVCHKAKTNTKKGELWAWYAPDIPLPLGPERWGGLPGMILGTENPVTKNTIWAIRIDIPVKTPVAVTPCQDGKKISRHDFDQIVRAQNSSQQKILDLINKSHP